MNERKRKKSDLRKEAERLQRLMEDASRSLAGDEESRTRKMLTFLLEEERYGLPLERLEEVLDPPSLAPVPGSPVHVLGVASIRGEVVPVLDLRSVFGHPAGSVAAERARVLLLGKQDDRLGLLVDSVAEVDSWSRREILPLPEDADDRLQGEINVRGNLVNLIDLDRLLESLKGD